jgi:hypothetical protein
MSQTSSISWPLHLFDFRILCILPLSEKAGVEKTHHKSDKAVPATQEVKAGG